MWTVDGSIIQSNKGIAAAPAFHEVKCGLRHRILVGIRSSGPGGQGQGTQGGGRPGVREQFLNAGFYGCF